MDFEFGKYCSTMNIEGIKALLGDKVDKFTVFPGFCDVHVHLREPGFFYKESIKTGTMAGARGGYTALCSMPNLKPVSDTKEHLQEQIDIINRDAVIDVYPYGAITIDEKGKELVDFELVKDMVIAFSDDGKGVQSDEMMKEAMMQAKSLGKMIVAHCEDESYLNGGYIHDGVYAKEHGHRGIPSISEWKQVDRDLNLVAATGVSYHVCHVSTKETVELIRQAKKSHLSVSCETGPHYLLLTENDLKEDGKFKMNPPIRSYEDRDALIEGIVDGTIEIIATDHAPHSNEEKSKGLEKSSFGIVGLETAFPLLWTYLVKKKIITLDKLIELISINPKKRFNIVQDNSYTIWDLNKEYIINPNVFLSKGHATPFEGWKVCGECVATIYNGKVVYKNGVDI